MELPLLNELLPASTCAGTRFRSHGYFHELFLLRQDAGLDRKRHEHGDDRSGLASVGWF
jgi:hypothetical protein